MKMTKRLERDLKLDADELSVVIRERKQQLDKLYRDGKACKNAFVLRCIAQDYKQLKAEIEVLDSLV